MFKIITLSLTVIQISNLLALKYIPGLKINKEDSKSGGIRRLKKKMIIIV